MFEKYPELVEACKKCKLELPFSDFDTGEINRRLEYVSWFLKERKPLNMEQSLELLNMIKGIKEDLGF
ncbi:hypothetical protein TpMuguga_04g02380 [Theileria parva strain Muguga]|uniref:uncharacterized protein n=1 Tax=Theileria parva strain Muguga TaxID=333668 RepID=UPI001C620FD6|nr:uncharacterized protein TpMuguga_04g02380 [Theileria parva strain Muguga]KAF5153203.1 hypothetical protein TpMuguga_04g02380 [Theileria parva strain Muguga]